jgi:putative spermidine/putrescine transport system permease protein
MTAPEEAATSTAAPGAATSGTGRRPLRRLAPYLPVAPFFAYVAIFLVYPTLIVVAGAFTDDAGHPTGANLRIVTGSVYLRAFARSIELSAATAVAGAVLGALLAWAVATGPRDGVLRRCAMAGAGVLAQFGGVTLAFAFIATVGLTGLVTVFLRDHLGIDLFSGGVWLFDVPGLMLVYTYFQIPLMVLVFLPALDGLRPQWREAVESLGGSGWHYWRHVAGPVLLPAFSGATLLLFANAFSAYATAAALITQGSPIVPLQIRGFLTSEVILGQENLGKALGFGMIVVVALVMTLYALLQRRAARWLR